MNRRVRSKVGIGKLSSHISNLKTQFISIFLLKYLLVKYRFTYSNKCFLLSKEVTIFNATY